MTKDSLGNVNITINDAKNVNLPLLIRRLKGMETPEVELEGYERQ